MEKNMEKKRVEDKCPPEKKMCLIVHCRGARANCLQGVVRFIPEILSSV